MEAILSLGFKNSKTRFIEFLPRIERIDFGLGHDFGSTSFNGDGPQREQPDVNVQIDEPKPATQQPRRQISFLDDLVIPNGIGVLERISYGSRKTDEPQIAVFSYLFFDRQPAHSFPNSSPAYPLHAYLALGKSFPHVWMYKTIAPSKEYFTEAPYEPAQSLKPYTYAAVYPLVHIALLEQFDPAKEAYSRATLPARLVSINFFYWGNAQLFPTITEQTTIEKTKPVEIATTFTKLLRSYTLLTQQAHSAQPKPEISRLYDGTPKTPFEIQKTKPTPKNSATLDENVRSTHRQLQIAPARHQIYGLNNHYLKISSMSTKQQTQVSEPRIESRLRILYNKIIETYHQIKQKYQQSLGRVALYKISGNYDMHPYLINILSNPQSDFWLYPSKYRRKIHSSQSGEYQRRNKKTLMQIIYPKNPKKLARQNKTKNGSSQKIEPGKKSTKTKSEEESGQQYNHKNEKPAYENKIYEESPENKQNSNNNKSTPAKEDNSPHNVYQKAVSSAVEYAGIALGAIAAFGIFGLANVAGKSVSLFENRTKSVYERKYDKEIKDATIDAVVAPPKVKDFNPNFVKEFEPWATGIENKLGIKVILSISDMMEESSYERYGKIETPAASIIKVSLAYAIASRIQKGLFDTSRLIPYTNELVLDREDKKDNKDGIGKISKYLTELNGVKYFKFDDLWNLMLRESNNTATNHLIYALMQEELQKLPQNEEEIRKRLDQSFSVLQNEMHLTGFKEIKIVSPYLDNEKLKALGYQENAYRLNVTTAIASRRFNEFILSGGTLTPEFIHMIINSLETEETTKYLQNILNGEYFWLKPGVDKHYLHMTGVVNGKSFTIMLSGFKDELYEKSDGKVDIHRRLTPAGKAAIDAMGEYFSMMYNNFSNSGEKRTYKSPFKPTPTQPAHPLY